MGLRGAKRLIAWQLGITLIIAGFCLLFFGKNSAFSALLGGLVSALPNIYFARKLFKYHGARAAKQIVNSFYKAEALKIVLSVILFALVFIFVNVVPIIFFATYIVAQMVFWFAPLIIDNKLNRPESD
nr:ATP synthase subunit I [Legionella sp. 27cVA30]